MQVTNGASEKYDDVLLPFLTLMRRELHANSRKGDRLRAELAKLEGNGGVDLSDGSQP